MSSITFELVEQCSAERARRVYSLALVSTGWMVSAVLTLRSFALGSGRIGWGAAPWIARVCSGSDETLASNFSHQFGFPIALWGVLYFAGIALLLALATRAADRIALMLTAAGCGMSAVLTASLIAAGAPFCPLCLGAHAINIVLLVALCRDAKTIAAAGFFLAGALLQVRLWHPPKDMKLAAMQFRTTPRTGIMLLRDDAILGPADGKVRLTVFSSFQCPGCRSFAGVVQALNRRYGQQLTIVFKNFPLGKDCNPLLKSEMQPQACAAARAAEAAGRQGAFWPYHDRLFAGPLIFFDQRLRETAQGLGLDMARWEADRSSPEIGKRISIDVSQASKLGVNGTPAVYLNGRRVPDTSRSALFLLVDQELRNPS